MQRTQEQNALSKSDPPPWTKSKFSHQLRSLLFTLGVVSVLLAWPHIVLTDNTIHVLGSIDPVDYPDPFQHTRMETSNATTAYRLGGHGHFGQASSKDPVDDADPFQLLAISNATTVYHIGWDGHFGQTNNQLVAILHALDMAFDENGEVAWDGSNVNSILAISGWAKTTLGLFLSTNPSQHSTWTTQLHKHLPIVSFDQLEHVDIPAVRDTVKVSSGDAYYYSQKNQKSISPARIQRRRKLILRKLLSMIPEAQHQRLEKLKTQLKLKNVGEKYVAVHLRSLDGQCRERVGQSLSNDECNMSPAYIKQLLLPRYSNLDQVPIVVISDMRRSDLLQDLLSDPEIGRNIIVAEWMLKLPKGTNTVVQDMVVAAYSEFFIGPRVSSMSVMIGLMRVALGANPETNLIYVRERGHRSSKSYFEVCADCVFFCDRKISTICGERTIYA